MFAITIVLLALFYFGGDLPHQVYQTPVYTGSLLGWAYILFFLCAGFSLLFPLVRLATRPKEAVKTLISLVLLIGLVLVAYALSDGTIMEIAGYDGPDNVPSMLKLADMMIFTMYFLGFVAVGAIIVTEVIKKFR